MPSDDTTQQIGAHAKAAEQDPIEVLSPDDATLAALDDDESGEQLALRNLEARRKQQRRKRRIKIIAACVAAGGIVAVLLGRMLFSQGEVPEEFAPETAVVTRADFENVISSSGALKAGSTVIVTPEVDGVIESVSVTEGQEVKEGEVLFTLKNDALDKAIRDAGQEVESANQGVASAQRGVSQANEARDEAWSRYYDAWNQADEAHCQWEYLKKNYASLHAAWEAKKRDIDSKVQNGTYVSAAPTDPGIEPSQEDVATYNKWVQAKNDFIDNSRKYEAYQAALVDLGDEPQQAGEEPTYPESPEDSSLIAAIESAQDGVTSANQALTKAREAYDEAVKEAEKRSVKAPTSGNVVSIGAKVGAAVGGASGATEAAGSTPLVQISDVNKMAIDIEVNEIDILSVRKGQKAKVTFSAVPDAEVDAEVVEVATVASAGAVDGGGGGVVTFHVGLVIDKPDDRLRPGMTASVKIYTAKVENALVVPVGAISEGADGTSVEVVTDEETMATETRIVKVGERSSTEAVIEEGLQEGETIVTGAAGSDESFDEEFVG